MRRSSTLWLVAILVAFGAAMGTIYTRMDIPAGEEQLTTGAAPAGVMISRGVGRASAPAQYEPIPVFVGNTADAILQPGRVPSAPIDEAVGRPESPIGDRMATRLRRRALRTRFTDGVDAGYSIPPMLDPPGVSITNYQDGPDAEDNTGFLVPPDPEIAAGPDHLLTAVNSVFGIHDKVGGAPTFFDSDAFFSADPNCPLGTFDPDVIYDEDAGRFVMGYDAGGTHYCVAFSDDADPNGSWNLYSIATAFGGEFFDYPHIGVGPECIGLGANMFAGGFVGSDVWCMKKADGNPLTVVMGTTGFSSTPQFANMHGQDLVEGGGAQSAPHYIITDDLFDGQTFGVFVWDALMDGGDPVPVSTPAWTPGGGGFPIDTPQSGADTLSANDWRIQAKPEQRDGSIWPTATVSANPTGQGTVNCFQWAQYDIGSNSVLQGGLTCPDTNIDPLRNAIFADGAVNACGDFFVGFTRSQATDDPGTAICGTDHHIYHGEFERGDTPLNSMRCGKGLQRGEIPYDAFDGAPLRWGDYSGMAVDPNGKDFWYFGEYSKNLDNGIANWGTNIGSITTDCIVDAVN